MMTRRTLLTTMLAACSPWSAYAQASPRVLWIWSGAVTSTGATVKALANRPGLALRLKVSPQDSLFRTATVEQTATTSARGVATFVFEGLHDHTRYRYTVAEPAGHELEGAFRTFANGPSSFRLAFGSCATTGSTSLVFQAIRATHPDLFIHMGDLHYEDIGLNDVALFGQAYTRVLTSRAQSPLFRDVPVAYTWDDHDFGPNDSDRTSPSRKATLEAYRTYVPHYPIPGGPDTPINQSFQMGRVRIVLTDVRSARSPRTLPSARRTMLGAAQCDWLERQFAEAADAPLIICVNSVPWITKANEASREGWAPYSLERERIANTIARLGITNRLIMLSGDAHMLAIDDGTNSQYATGGASGTKGFVVVHAAPMDRRSSQKGGPYSHGVAFGNGQFATLDVDDDGTRVKVTIKGRRGTRDVPGMRLELTV